ncbi:actin [Bathycoccus prasinos]|uniref:Actin n=1 Tax=Bathycoccus prasinos TaxID=41875 RepID=K8EMB1_9CHLO|nr:actin [Bathycoccus prasinos]CCO19114.1 actin [Bathycoccus prasinos]|eukprot:XP_007509999.1 actin [Bathycoccus prasinos]
MSNEDNSPPPVVLDNGTGYVKCGFASAEESPPIVFPSCVGRRVVRFEEALDNSSQNSSLTVVGQECIDNRQNYEVSYPIKNGIVTSWQDMILVWEHAIYDELKLTREEIGERTILLTEAPQNPIKNREKMVEIMFTHFGFKGVFVHVQAVLTLYSQGLMTGLVLDSGDGVSHVVPVIDGFTKRQATKRLDIAGRTVTERLIELLGRRGYAVGRTNDVDSIREMKESVCFVAKERKRWLRLARETTACAESYELPDGRRIKVESERFMAPEIMFEPSLVGVESVGVSELVFECRGSTTFPGFGERLKKDLIDLYKERILKSDPNANVEKFVNRVNVETPADRKYSVFVGGSVLANIMKDNDKFWVTRHEYEKLGITKALRKCEGTFHE